MLKVVNNRVDGGEGMNLNYVLQVLKPYMRDNNVILLPGFNVAFKYLGEELKHEIQNELSSRGYVFINLSSVDYDSQINAGRGVLVKHINTADEIFYYPASDGVQQSNEILCALIKRGNEKAKNDICIKNKSLVYKVAKKYLNIAGNDLDIEDLEQYGMMGLLRATETFDSSIAERFSTYAVPWIRQHILRAIYDNGFTIRVPVHMMELIARITDMDNKLARLGINFTERINKIARVLNMDTERVEEVMVIRNCYLNTASLDVPIGEEEETLLSELIPDEGKPSVEDQVMAAALRDSIDAALSQLKSKERTIIIERFGLDSGHPKTLEVVGQKYGVTRERIRQIEAKALKKLRSHHFRKLLQDYYEER